MSTQRKAIKVLPLPIRDLDKLSLVLNKAAADGFAILDSCFIPAKDGGVIIYILADVSEADEEDTAEDIANAAPETHVGSNGASELPNPQIIESAEV